MKFSLMNTKFHFGQICLITTVFVSNVFFVCLKILEKQWVCFKAKEVTRDPTHVCVVWGVSERGLVSEPPSIKDPMLWSLHEWWWLLLGHYCIFSTLTHSCSLVLFFFNGFEWFWSLVLLIGLRFGILLVGF